MLRDPSVPDEVLLKELSDLVAREGEHMKKVKGKGVMVGMVGVESENRILKELGTLTDSLASMKIEVMEMKQKLEKGETGGNGSSGGTGYPAYRGGFQSGGYQRGFNRRSRGGSGYVPFNGKCEECQKTGEYCDHCSLCGGSDHKRRDCPKNK